MHTEASFTRAIPGLRLTWPLWGLAAAIAVGLAVRLAVLDYGLPFIYYGDERYLFLPALRIAQTGDLNPTRLDYGSLFVYVLAAVYWLAAQLGLLPVVTNAPLSGYDLTYYPVPDLVLVGRGLAVAFSLVALVGVFLVGQRLFDARVGALAAALLALSPLTVFQSRFGVTDTLLQALTIFGLWAILRLVETVTWRRALLAGVLVGLSASAKYPGLLLSLPLVAAILLSRSRPRGRWPLVAALGAAGVAFLLTTPFTVLDWPKFMVFLSVLRVRHVGPSVVYEGGPSALWYVREILGRGERAMLLLGLVGGVLSALRRPREAVICWLFPLALFATMNSGGNRSLRYLLPILAVLAVFAAYALVALIDALPARRRWLGWLAAAVCLVSLLAPTLMDIQALRQPDARALAAAWVRENAGGMPLFSDDMALADDPSLPRITRAVTVVEHPAAWYAEHGYLLFASDFRRWDPNRSVAQEQLWQAFEADPTLELVAHLDGHMWGVPGYGVRIYRPRPAAQGQP